MNFMTVGRAGSGLPVQRHGVTFFSVADPPLMSAPRVLVRTLVEAPLGGDVLLLDGIRTIRVEDPVRRRQCHDERVQSNVEARRGAAEGG